MRIAVTGSIATDYLMTFSGKITEQLAADKLDSISLSFLVDQLDVRRGGVAANISFGLGNLGLRPILVDAVGRDFDEYRAWLDKHGVDTDSVYVSDAHHTARFLCTTDLAQNQIASFYAGAMAEARNIDLGKVADRVGNFDLVVIGAGDPGGMKRHTEICRSNGYPFAADISQQLALLDGDGIKELVDGAEYLFTNEYEAELLQQKTGWSHDEVLSRVGKWVTTLGAAGVRLESKGAEPVQVPCVPAKQKVDPTGIGDGFRSGFFAGLSWELPTERALQLGCAIATTVLEVNGPQEYKLDTDNLVGRLADTYGEGAASEVAKFLPKA